MKWNKDLKEENYKDLVSYRERIDALREKIIVVRDEMEPSRTELTNLPTVLDAQANIDRWKFQLVEAQKNPAPDSLAIEELEEQIATYTTGIARKKELTTIVKQLSIKLSPLQKEQQTLLEEVKTLHREFEIELKQEPLRLEAMKNLVSGTNACGMSISQTSF